MKGRRAAYRIRSSYVDFLVQDVRVPVVDAVGEEHYDLVAVGAGIREEGRVRLEVLKDNLKKKREMAYVSDEIQGEFERRGHVCLVLFLYFCQFLKEELNVLLTTSSRRD